MTDIERAATIILETANFLAVYIPGCERYASSIAETVRDAFLSEVNAARTPLPNPDVIVGDEPF